MDIKTAEQANFTLSETTPSFHELLAIRDAQGRQAVKHQDLDASPVEPVFSVCIRQTLDDTSPLVAVAQVIRESSQYLHIRDFIVRAEYQQFGLAKIMMERIMLYFDTQSDNIYLGIKASGEEELLCQQFGFNFAQCANLGPNMIKTSRVGG